MLFIYVSPGFQLIWDIVNLHVSPGSNLIWDVVRQRVLLGFYLIWNVHLQDSLEFYLIWNVRFHLHVSLWTFDVRCCPSIIRSQWIPPEIIVMVPSSCAVVHLHVSMVFHLLFIDYQECIDRAQMLLLNLSSRDAVSLSKGQFPLA